MAATPDTLPELITGLFWPAHPISQTAVLLLLGFALLVAATVYVPLLLRLFQIGQLQRSVQACFDEEGSNAIQRQEVGNAFSESPLAYQWTDFVRRWQNAIAADPIQNASLPELSRAPVRLMDVLDEHPVVPAGARRSLLPALPALFLSAGLLGAFSGLVLALPGIGLSLDPPASEATNRAAQIAALMDHLGMALRIGLWGLLLSLGAAITGRFIEGRAELLAETLDGWVQLAYGAISTGELASRTAHEQRSQLVRLQDDVSELLRQLSGRPRPLIRSSAPVPGAGVATVDPAALETSVEALRTRLAEQLDHTVSEQLAGLRESLGGTIERLADRSGTPGDLTEVVDRLSRSSESQHAASRTLTQAAHTVSDAAEELRSGLDDFAGVVTRMRETSDALGLTAARLEGTHASTGRSAERLGDALDRLEREAAERARGLDERLAGLRASLEELLERVDGRAPAATPSGPQPTRPAPGPPSEAGRLEPSRDASRHPADPPARPAAEPARPIREAGQTDTLPIMKAPSPEMIYAARSQAAPAPAAADEPPSPQPRRAAAPPAGGTLSGLLRATHHTAPPADLPHEPDDFDPDRTVSLDRFERDGPAEPGEDEAEAGDEDGARPTRRGGLFGRRK